MADQPKCQMCGALFQHGRRGPRSAFCSRRCQRGAGPHPPCFVCGGEVEGYRRLFCSKECQDVVHRRPRRPGPRSCDECGELFQPQTGAHRFCSRRCYKRVDRRRRRGSRAGAAVGLAQIGERDEWTCGICRRPVDRRLEWPDPASATLDHVLAVSLGGSDDETNMQLAHLGCNCRKGTEERSELNRRRATV